MQVARVSSFKDGCVRIPRLFQETFHLFGGEEVTLFPQKDKNCLLIFMGPIYSPMLRTIHLRRVKATVADNPGASSDLYKAIEANRKVKILSAQGTTTGRDSSAVGDILLHVPADFDAVEFVLNVLAKNKDCTIGDLREPTPIESSSMDWGSPSSATIQSDGRELPVPREVLRDLGENRSHEKVIINWDTETTVLELTFVRSSDKIGSLILFLRDGDDHRHTGEVGGILKGLGVDFLWLQINHLGHAKAIPFLLEEEGHVKRWIVVADFSKAAPTEEIAESLQKHSDLFYGGLIGVQSDNAILFGNAKTACSSRTPAVRNSALSFSLWANKLWSAEDDELSSVSSNIGSQ